METVAMITAPPTTPPAIAPTFVPLLLPVDGALVGVEGFTEVGIGLVGTGVDRVVDSAKFDSACAMAGLKVPFIASGVI